MMIAVGILWMRGLLISVISIVNWFLEIIYNFRRVFLRVCTVIKLNLLFTCRWQLLMEACWM